LTADGFPDADYVRSRVEKALVEDGANSDATVSYLGLQSTPTSGSIVVGADGVVAGIDVARLAFTHLDPDIEFETLTDDGVRVVVGQTIANLSGRAGAILTAERVALNFLQRLSGIATLTSQFVSKLQGTGIRVLDTRKTTPSLRRLERYAVRAGGGVNHRFNLADMILIKENHIRSHGGIESVCNWLSRHSSTTTIEIEVDSLDFLRKLLGLPIDRIMLDNFSPGDVRHAVQEIRQHHVGDSKFSPTIEVSGGITLDNVREYAIDGVEEISVGAITHSAMALDLSLEIAWDMTPD